MKKIVIGVCGILVFIGGLAGLRSGVLKAGELTQESSLIVETGTAESAVSVPESSEMPANEGVVPDSEVVAPVEEKSEGAEEEPPVPVEPSVSSESTPSTSSEPDSSESSTEESSSSTSSSVSSSNTSTSSSTKPSSSSSTSSSTKPSSTPSTSTKPSNTKPSATTPSSSVPTQPFTSPSKEEPKPPSTLVPVIPSSPAATAPATPAYSSVQEYSFVAPSAPEVFSETSNLKLPSELKTTEVAQSDLKGFELPLLSSFKNKAHAAVIYEGIKQLGTEQEENYDAKQLATDMYQNLFDLEITGTPEKMPEEITVGSLLYQKKKDKNVLLGVYIGEDYYLAVDDVEIDEEETTKNSSTEAATTEESTKTSNSESTVTRIKGKFEQTSLSHKAIQTLWGKGYRINPELLDRIQKSEALNNVVSNG